MVTLVAPSVLPVLGYIQPTVGAPCDTVTSTANNNNMLPQLDSNIGVEGGQDTGGGGGAGHVCLNLNFR